MCGISGIFHLNFNKVNQVTLDKMTDSMFHRGPNGRGTFVHNNVGFGHRRLSIIDIEGGKQPMQDITKRYTLVFNGEIYNYLELRNELIKAGCQLSTHSDTEVMLYSYIHWGSNFVSRLNGMFAFAIFDIETNSIIAGRDRLGIKPFYYYFKNNIFIFASEVKAILLHPSVKKETNLFSISQYMTMRYALKNNTFFNDIKSMPAAHLLHLSKRQFKLEKYWTLNNTPSTLSFSEAQEELEKKLKYAVNKRLIADVPIGAFLSGGIDSTSIISHIDRKKIMTITMGFKGSDELCEIEQAKKISNFYGTSHHEVMINATDMTDLLPKLIYHRDGPLEVQNEIAIFQMSSYLKKFFTVVLSGEGADEAFIGYPKYINTTQRWNQYKKLKILSKSTLGLSDFFLSLGLKNNPYSKLQSLNLSEADEYSAFISSTMLGQNFNQKLFNLKKFKNIKTPEIFLWHSEFFKNNKNLPFIKQLLKFDHENHLNSLLMRIDRMTMAASVEGRVPFLDHELFEFAWSLPSSYKYKDGIGKRILRNNLEKKLPNNLIQKTKIGFAIPHNQWLMSKKYQEFVKDILLSKTSLDREYFVEKEVVNCLNKAIDKNQDPLYQEYIWRMINLEIWHRTF